MNNNQLLDFLNQLGLTEEEAQIFQSLTLKGIQTTLQISRDTGINRTHVYRLIENLKERGLVEEVVDEYRKMAKAADIHQLELLIKKEEIKTKLLKETFPTIANLISSQKETSQPGTRVLFYRGLDGIKQQGWNTLQAKKECVGFTYRLWAEVGGIKFAQEWADEWVRRKLIFREIWSDELLRSKKQNPEIKPITYDHRYFKEKYIPPDILNINHQTDVYNNVVSIYNWYEGEVFGVEIYNEKVARLQKQLFEIVWKMAKKVK